MNSQELIDFDGDSEIFDLGVASLETAGAFITGEMDPESVGGNTGPGVN